MINEVLKEIYENEMHRIDKISVASSSNKSVKQIVYQYKKYINIYIYLNFRKFSLIILEY